MDYHGGWRGFHSISSVYANWRVSHSRLYRGWGRCDFLLSKFNRKLGNLVICLVIDPRFCRCWDRPGSSYLPKRAPGWTLRQPDINLNQFDHVLYLWWGKILWG